MPILVECPACRRRTKAEDQRVGSRLACAHCGQTLNLDAGLKTVEILSSITDTLGTDDVLDFPDDGSRDEGSRDGSEDDASRDDGSHFDFDSEVALPLDVEDSRDGASSEWTAASLVEGAIPPVEGAEFLESPLFEDVESKLFALVHQVRLLIDRREYDAASRLLRLQERLARDATLSIDLVAAFERQRASVAIARKDWATALDRLRTELTWLERIEQHAGIAACLGRQAFVLLQMKDVQAAAEMLHRHVRLCAKLGLSRELVESLALQADLQVQGGDLEAAYHKRQAEENLCRLHGYHAALVRCLAAQGLLLKQMKQFAEALDVFEEQERVARETGLTTAVSVALGYQAAIYEARHDFQSALALYRKGAEISRTRKDWELLARNLANQGHLLGKKMRRPMEGRDVANEAYAIATDHGLTNLAEQIDRVRNSLA